MSNNATASVENLKEEHESELQNYIEMCSGINIQFHEKEKEVQSPFFFFVKCLSFCNFQFHEKMKRICEV